MKRLIDGAALIGKLRTRKANAVGHPEVMDAYETAMNDAIDAQEITLNTLRDEVYQDAMAHGLYEEERYSRVHPFGLMYVCRNLALRIKSELCELIAATYQQTLDGFIEELADIIILCLSVAGHLGIDIDAAVRRKIEFNKTRPWKHEGEKHDQD